MNMASYKHYILLASALALSACHPEESANIEQSAPTTIQATTAVASLVSIPVYYRTSGMVTSDHRVAISSRLSGYIRGLKIHEGDRVRKGQLLFRIDPVDVSQVLAQANADAANALAEKERFASLLDAHAVTRQQYDTVALRYTLAQSRVKQARNQLRYTDIKAPLDGVVVSKLKHNGDLASPGQAVLVLENPSQLSVETYVAESRIQMLHEGDLASLTISGLPQPVKARIDHIIEDERASSHQFLVKLSLLDNAGIRPGVFAHVAFMQGERQALMIPASAVVYRSGLTGVYVLDANNIMHYRLLRLGSKHGELFEVNAGLHPAQRVISPVLPETQSGMKLLEERR